VNFVVGLTIHPKAHLGLDGDKPSRFGLEFVTNRPRPKTNIVGL